MQTLSRATCSYCGTSTQGETYCCPGCESLDQNLGAHPKVAGAELSYLDQSNFKSLYHIPQGIFDYQLYVEGIHCSSCVHLIEKLPSYDAAIEIARVDYAQSKLFLKVKPEFSLARTVGQLMAMGYRAHYLKPSDETSRIQERENKIFLKKMAVAGACAGNIMLFVIPIYAGLEGPWKTIFEWLSFLLFLPVVLYSGTSFYRGAWSALRLRTVNIDLPITLALWSGFVLSTLNLIRGNGFIYFDSTASFIFLILGSRYFLKRTQQKYLSQPQFEDLLGKDRFRVVENGAEEFRTLQELKKGDVLQLEAGQISPVDGEVQSAGALVDVSVLNGEPMPRHFERGMELLAGSKVLSSRITLKVTEEPKDTHLMKMLRELQEGFWKKSRFVALTDRCAQVLIVTVFAIALGFFILYFNQDPQEAFNRSLALIVLACPCALALGSPLALSLAVKNCQARGILIRNSDALEKILKVENIFFDKTGTLTEADLKLVSSDPALLPDDMKSLLLGLEQRSYHPVAFALRKAWPNLNPLAVTDLRETFGVGVSGVSDASFYEFGPLAWSEEAAVLALSLKKDGHSVATLYFENPLRPEAPESLKKLALMKKNTFVLSGDSKERVDLVASQCGISLKRAFGHRTAEQKREILTEYSRTCMIGDGTNDALALRAADVGIAVKGSTSVNLQAADICFTRGGLEPLIELFDLAQKAKRVLVRNLTFSLIYNFIGGILALTGYVNPWLAAVLMPLSSVLILWSTLWGLR